MRKFNLPKETEITIELINDLIDQHKSERARIINLKKYYSGENATIINKNYQDKNKPSNKLVNSYGSYITDNFVGYMVGQPIAYKSDNEKLLEEINNNFLYNDEIDNNTALAQEQSIVGYAYELLYRDEEGNVRFKSVDTESCIVIYDDTIEEKELFVIRYVADNKGNGACYVYTKDNEFIYNLEEHKATTLNEQYPNYFADVPICTYENNRQRIGDYEKVLSLIDAYDLLQSFSMNDQEYFTDALLVIKGQLMNEEDEQGRPLNFKDNRVLNFIDTDSEANYLIKDINDGAVENLKNRIKADIHKFANVVDLTDEKFAGNLSGVALKFKLQGMENVTAIKEAKFRKGLMKRIELITSFLNIKTNNLLTYTEITPVFTRNIPANDLETVNMVKSLYGIISDKTLLSQIPFIEDVQKELDSLEKQNSERAITGYENLGENDTTFNGEVGGLSEE